MTAAVYLLPLLFLSLSSLSAAWHQEEPGTPPPYAGVESSPNEAGYQGQPPPRMSNGGDTGTRPGSDAWNRAEQPESQFDYKDSNPGNGNAGTEKLNCGRDLYVSSDQIIDIQTSVQYGAQLLDGIYAYSFDGCVDACCEYSGCDLALYKVDGVSETGKTCYFVHCGLPDHCRMVQNEGFKAGFLINKPNYGELLEHSSEQDKIQATTHFSPTTSSSPSPSPSTHTVTTLSTTTTTTTTTAAPPTTQATPTEPAVVTMETTEHSESVTTAPAVSSESHSVSSETEEPTTEQQITTPTTDTPTTSSSEGSKSSVATSNPPSTSEPVTDSTPDESSSSSTATTSKVAIDNATRAQKEKEDYDECAKNGCDGRGLIAVSIVGTVLIGVLLVVAAVIGRRIYKLKTRRQYRNVDYLINGMYT